LGPALEIFSRHSRVERANGESVELKFYLEAVWAAVAKAALEEVFKDADVSGFEPDARLTAMWLWTLQGGTSGEADEPEEQSEDDDAEESDSGTTAAKVVKAAGFSLEFDAARKIAQGLGVNISELTSLVEVKGEIARLKGVSERAETLIARKVDKTRNPAQGALFGANDGALDAPYLTEALEIRAGHTRLDRLHQAMLLFAEGRLDGMKRLLADSGSANDSGFWRLADALSALYPIGTEEKRWVDGLLARKKSLGF
jgi:hypothetical protein